MLRKITITVASLLGLDVIMALVGWMLPKGHHASRTVTLAASPDTVYAVISEVGRYADWRSDVTLVELLPDEGRGLRFREHGGNGPIVFRVDHADPPRAFRVRIDDPGQPFGGTWTYALVPEETGTSLTITEDGEVYNPIFRVLSRFVFSQTATMDAYLAALHRHLAH